ncbi:MAG: alpha/beta hydrolase, partial [Deltaproteobacteria bacterium]|nr:alpha/beta hydrolase [Deltaproteobacteria bacterium]
SLSVPALIIWGEQDEILPMEHGRRLARALPNSRLVILPECGHNPMEEKPRETLREVRQFLEGLEGKKGP